MFLVIRTFVLFGFLVSLFGCSTYYSNDLDEPKSTFFTNARLWTGERSRDYTLDASGFNATAKGEVAGITVDYVDYLNPDATYRDSPAEQAEIQMIRAAGGSEIDPNGFLRVNFQNDSMDFFVRQMLGGFLGVNYIIGDPLEGTVTFVTEKPIPRSQVLPVVRAVLARNGYVLKLVGSVFHVARPDTISALEQNQRLGEQSIGVSRIVDLGNPVADQLATSLQPILPETVLLVPSVNKTRLVVRAPQTEIDAAVELIEQFLEDSGERTAFAIIRLRRTSPTVISEQVLQFFESQAGGTAALPITVIPIENQAALLVSAQSTTALNNLRKLVTQLDYQTADTIDLRIIPLRNVPASEIASQLAQAFQASYEAPKAQPRSVIDIERQSQFGDLQTVDVPGNIPTAVGGATDEFVPEEEPAPDILPPQSEYGEDQNGKQEAKGGARQKKGEKGKAPGAEVTIVADERNNTLLVRSDYRTFQRIRDAVHVLDIPLAQVVIEATIIEVELTQDLQFGVQWLLSGSGFTVRSSQTLNDQGTITDSGGPGFAAAVSRLLGGVTIDAVIQALDSITNVKVISSPYLTVLNRKTARLVVGDQIPYELASSEVVSDTTTTTTEVQIVDTGIILEIAPTIRSDNSIELAITQQVSTPRETTPSTELTPTIATRSVVSDIVVQSGQTAILGGLIQERKESHKTATPTLEKIPFLGYLFKQTDSNATRTELFIMITPRVVRKATEIQKITNRMRQYMTVR